MRARRHPVLGPLPLLLAVALLARVAGEGASDGAPGPPNAVAAPAEGSVAAPAEQEEADDSVRCRMSGICDGSALPALCAARPPVTAEEYAALDPEQRDAVLACTPDPLLRAGKVAEAVAWSWKGYRECAWGWDELKPLSCSGDHWLNLTLTLVDSLDTLYLAGLSREFQEAAEHVVQQLDLATPGAVNLFETTIRIVGGLLSAHHLSRNSHPALSAALGRKAAELGTRLLPAFTASPSGIPFSDVNLRTGEATSPSWAKISSLSEISTLSLEFTHLARLTGRAEFENVALAVHEKLTTFVEQYGGLLPLYFNPESGDKGLVAGATAITLGARADSYYEYLLKQWVLTGKRSGLLLRRYVHAIRSVRSRLVRRTAPPAAGGLVYVGEQHGSGTGGQDGKMDHLVCFLPGLLALGHYHGVDTSAPIPAPSPSSKGEGSSPSWAERMGDLELAEALAATCYELYRRTPSGLAPEIVHFTDLAGAEEYPKHHSGDVGHGHFAIKQPDAHNLLRPETVESLYVLWRVTGRPRYREWAWAIFRAFQRWARVQDVPQCVAMGPASPSQQQAEASESSSGGEAVALVEPSSPEQPQQQQGGDAGQGEGQQEQPEYKLLLPKGAAQAEEQPQQSQQDGEGSEEGNAGRSKQPSLPSNPKLDTPDQRRLRARLQRASDAAARTRLLLQQRQAQSNGAGGAAGEAAGGGSNIACLTWAQRSGGYTNLQSVVSVPPPRRDKMESFWVAETLKYLYLIFAEPPERCTDPTDCWAPPPQRGPGGNGTLIPFQAYVFNTEAHPLPIVGPQQRGQASAQADAEGDEVVDESEHVEL